MPLKLRVCDVRTNGISLNVLITVTCEPGSSVSIVSVYGLDDRTIEVCSLAEAKGFFL